MRDAMDAFVLRDEQNKRGWQSRVVLIPRRWDSSSPMMTAGDGGYKARYTEESAG
jgi:hypothetical protein